MANIFAKSGRKKSVFYVGKIKLANELVDTGLTNAEFKANKVLVEALDRGIIAVGLPEDDKPTNVADTSSDETTKDNVVDTDSDDDGLPDDKESLIEIAESYGLEFNPQLGAKKLKILISEHIAEQE